MPLFEFHDLRQLQKDDDVRTESSREQASTEGTLNKFYNPYIQKQALFFDSLVLFIEEHTKFAKKGLRTLPSYFDSLDASRPWFCFWCCNALSMLPNLGNDPTLVSDFSNFLGNFCQDKEKGGIAGGPGQLSHVAPTFSGTIALCALKANQGLDLIDKQKMYSFLYSLKDPVSKGFRMHVDGEVDTRGCFCALIVATVLNIMDDKLTEGVAEYIVNCQTYEGGIGAYPGVEAHGGYTYCGLAAMMFMKKAHLLDLDSLTHWLARRQMSYEGGFQGRTNKLVDACYSFWVGASFPLLEAALVSLKDPKDRTELDQQILDYLQWQPPTLDSETRIKYTPKTFSLKDTLKKIKTHHNSEEYCQIEEMEATEPYLDLQDSEWMFNQTALQEYLLLCCQQESGGLRDKPVKQPDFYHTCYALFGLSISQHNPSGSLAVLGDCKNLLRQINPLFQMCTDSVSNVLNYYGGRTSV
ncbi:farnesyltransferase beta subunit [Naegleria gruberi]|uniref:Protein farnesyltransferase subunit beta n=1 Tax=Naegleria gruberi TaxID=5762 RepID=D2V4P3_NAEGR|nr:farnesyltransferase beta subunit [Naegleria gruberi]EFC47966.1 farnesyltransferase beta subunit [Naegleria gruberi]|eukprot:XP_002680710.1 farnesyltransferase beta subunit [Naegleria gruberi strain NEG-M]